MPELPEVELITRKLSQVLPGRVIRCVDLFWPKTVATPNARLFRRRLQGQRVAEVFRRAKYVVILLKSRNKEQFLLIHLRMSGVLSFSTQKCPRKKHDRAVICFTDGSELCFNDTRKFGRVYLVDDAETVLGKLGPEPLAVDFSCEAFAALLRKHRGALKPLLLSQRFVAGLGNIYADEALWEARLHPLRQANALKPSEVHILYRAIRSTLRRAIKKNGTDFGDGVVESGLYKPKVYGRGGEKCLRCGNLIKRMLVSQRGTCYCPSCQEGGAKRIVRRDSFGGKSSCGR